MANAALDRWLLVDYAGYPYAPNSLMPDNGLANLAGALVADGREVEILDYCTVSTLRRMTTPALTGRLTKAWNALRRPAGGGLQALRQLLLLPGLQQCERERQRLLDGLVAAVTEEILDRIRSRGVQAVGFKLWNGDGFEGAVRMAHAIRARAPGVKLFAGGPQVDFFMERILARHACFDAVVYGEGEETIRLLAQSGADPAAYAAIPNLLFAGAGAVCRTEMRMVSRLDDLPPPVYDPAVYPAMRGDEKIKIMVVDESRGCRNNCAFCIHPIKSHRDLRTKSVPRLIEEVSLLLRQPGCRTFRFAGSCTPYSLLNGFAAELLNRDMRVEYASFAHIRDSQEADFALMRRSGCLALFFGIESGSQRILDRIIHKGIKVDEIAQTIRRVKAAGIFAVGSLIHPAPGEDAESEAQTLRVLAEERPDAVTLQAPVVAPRTEWFESPEQHGVRIDDRERYLDAAMEWKIKLVLPASFWTPLPVRIDGKSYRSILKQTVRFSRRLAELGVPTAISDETYLMSRKCGMDPVAFRDEVVRAFFCGDGDTIAAFTARINLAV
jgi:anaerobic magnesium-protoporphyrin IX monomethyl ester cyclase